MNARYRMESLEWWSKNRPHMRRFDLIEPKSLQEACVIIGDDPEAKLIAGGTALLAIIKQGLYLPKTLVNLKKVRTAGDISYDPRQGLRIGALASIQDVENLELVRQHYPILAEACHVVANIRIRHMATVGGNLAHGDYQSDPPAALMVLDARVEIIHHRGARQLKLSEFQLGSYETALEPGELVSAITIPPIPGDSRGVYVKFTTGSSEERPCVGVAALVQMEDGHCRALRLAIGAVSHRPMRIAKSEEMARGEKLTAKLIEEIAANAAQTVEPIDDLRGPADYKRHLVQVLTRRAVTACANSATGSAQ